jgi:hypothetical protein
VRAALTKEGGERSIADRLRVRKALDLIVENARVTEGEWKEEEDTPVTSHQVESNAPTGDESEPVIESPA